MDRQHVGQAPLEVHRAYLCGTAVKISGREELRLESGFATLPDVKHVDNIIALADLGENPKSSPTPGLKRGRYDIEWDDKLTEEAAANFRSGTGSAIWLGQDRDDIAFSAKELAGHLRETSFVDWVDFVRLARYLVGQRDVSTVNTIDRTKPLDTIRGHTDAKWDIKSTSGVRVTVNGFSVARLWSIPQLRRVGGASVI